MAETKFLDSAGLTHLLEKTNAKFSKLGHTHTKAEITDFAHTHDDRYYTETEIDSKLNGKSNTGHTHDDRYYTESEMNTKLAGKSDTTHSHATHLTTEIAASTNLNTLTAAGWYKCSSSATAANLTNCPTKNAFAMEVLSNAGTTQTVYEYMASGQKIYTRNCYDSAWGAWHRIYTEADKPTLGELGAAASGHTHNYAGSSSSGGSANSAVKLDSSAGSATQPVYFSGGKPVATTYTLGKSVPADAVFTDTNTHYASKNVVGSATATSNTTAALTNGNVYLNSVENGAVTSAHKISGSGATTVTTDASGNIVVNSTNTTYSSLKNPYALTVSLNGTSQGAYDGSAAKSINVTPSSIGAYTKGEVDSKLNGKAASSHTHGAGDITSVNASAISGVIAAANLPSFVDDVLEGYYGSDGVFYKNHDASSGKYSDAYTGETGKIYVDFNTNKTYRWSGSAYVVISETIALGETSSTAYRGDRGKTAYNHSQITSGNPHKVTKSDVGLGSVDNTSDANKSVKYAKSATANNPIKTTGTGAAYAATVDGITALTIGAKFTMVPHTVSTTTAPTLNVNGLGAKNIRMRLTSSTTATIQLTSASFLTANKPVNVTYDGTYWVIDDFAQPDVNSLYGTVPISKGGTGATTAAKALTNLGAMPKAKSLTASEFSALATKDADTLYMITDDTEEEKVQAHIANTTVHITAAERAKWNAKADITIGTAEPTSSTSGIFYIQTN